MKLYHLAILLGLGFAPMMSASPAVAQDQPAETSPASPAPAAKPISVAVLGFDTGAEKDDTGKQISEVITLYLSAEPGFQTVDRQSLQATLEEQSLNLTGLVNTEDAVKVGRLVGARIIVVGRSFELGNSRMITVKLIGTETTLIEGVVERGPIDKPLDEIVLSLAEQVAKKLRESGAKLVASEDPIDPLPALIARLKGRELPTCAVIVFEEHLRQRPADAPPDPAVETEIKRALIQAGVVVKDVPDNDLADWARQGQWNQAAPWPRSLEGVEAVITGEAFSEPAGSIGNLRSCLARAEINLITRADGRITLADRVTTRAVDLAESIAGKTALEKAGRQLSLAILTYLDQTAPATKEPAPQPGE